MSAPLLQIVYASSAPAPVSHDELVEILRVSRRNNAAVGVTGALLYADGTFMQALEGPADAVEAVYERVRRDGRHRGVLPLLRSEVAERSFPEWSMGFHRLDALAEADLGGARTLDDLTADGADRAHRLLGTFRSFLPGVRAHVAT